MKWEDSQHCLSHQHCCACPYVLEWTEERAMQLHFTRLDRALIEDHWEPPAAGECPHGVTLEQAAVFKRKAGRFMPRSVAGRVVKRLLRELIEHGVSLPGLRTAVSHAVVGQECALWMFAETAKSLGANGVIAPDAYRTATLGWLSDLLAISGNLAAYLELRACVEEGVLTVAEGTQAAQQLGITEPDGV